MKQSFFAIALYYTALKLLLLALAFLKSPSNVLSVLVRWDSVHYIDIAKNGYVQPENYAFAYAYPFLIKLLSQITANYELSAFLLSNLFGYMTLFVVYKTFGFDASLVMSFFPTFVVYTFVPYSEPITLFLISLALYAVKRAKNNSFFSSLFYSLSILSSYSTAIALPSFLLLKRKKSLLLPIFTGIGILAFFALKTGDPFYYFHIEKSYWDAGFVSPIEQARWILNGWFTQQDWRIDGIALSPYYWLVRNMIFEVFFIASTIALIGEGSFYVAFSLLIEAQLLFISGVPAISIPRLIIKAVPAFYGASKLLRGRALKLYIAICIPVSVFVFYQHITSFFA